jgi:hypothetical protein
MGKLAHKEVNSSGTELFPLIGNLREYFLPELLFQLYESEQNGTLVFALGEFKKALVYNGGEIVLASSTLKEDSLGEALVRSGTISLSDFALAQTKVSSDMKFGQVLLQMECIDEQTLQQGLTYQMHGIVYSLFLWPSGQFRFAKDKLPDQKLSDTPLSTLEAILRGTTLIRSWAKLREKLPTLDIKLNRSKDFDTRITRLKLYDHERRILEIIQPGMLASDVCVLSPVNEFETCRFLVACLVIRLLEISHLTSET